MLFTHLGFQVSVMHYCVLSIGHMCLNVFLCLEGHFWFPCPCASASASWKIIKVLLAYLNAEVMIFSSLLDCRENKQETVQRVFERHFFFMFILRWTIKRKCLDSFSQESIPSIIFKDWDSAYRILTSCRSQLVVYIKYLKAILE